MLIAIDGNEANVKERVGINVYSFEVLHSFYQLRTKNPDFKYLKFRVLLKNKPLQDLPKATDWWQYEMFGPRPLWTWIALPKRLYLGSARPDILLSLSHYGPLASPVPYLVSIMDVGFLRWKEQFTKKDYYQLKYGTWWSAKRAQKIITISQFSKKDIAKSYNIDPKKIIVSYPGYNEDQKSLPAQAGKIKNKYNINNDYLLCLGTLKPSKNVRLLIEAFSLITEEFPGLQLVIAGKKGWLYEDIFKLVKSQGLENKVVFTGYVSDLGKNTLMSHAKALILPSLWEGFGIPVLEALAAGTKVVCSGVASLPEIAGKAAIYIDNPEDEKSIAKAIEKVIKLNNQERKVLVEAGYKQVKKFSWQKTGEIILKSILYEG